MAGIKRESSESDSKVASYWQLMAPACKPDQLQQQAQLSHQCSITSPAGADDYLFTTPSDLLCPITLGLFQDPVCNALGQVYEKAAIQRHLVQAAINGQAPTDPISNAVLPSLDLVPVFPMRSRAAQYRESTARSCVQIAASPECADPVRYLRRAAELMITVSDCSTGSNPNGATAVPASNSNATSGLQQQQQLGQSAAAAGPPAAGASAADGMAFSIPGMTLDFARYLAAHPGSAYDALVLKYFGNELLRAGFPDAAADVFYRLLLEADDRVQQAEYLQLCLDCWTSSSSSSSSATTTSNSSSSAAEADERVVGQLDSSSSSTVNSCSSPHRQQQQQYVEQQQHQDHEPVAAHDPVIIGKLADFVQRQRCLSPSAIVHMLQGMNRGPVMALHLCQVLLSRAAATAGAAAGPEAEAAVGLPGGIGGALEVLLSLVELGNYQLQGQLQSLAAQVKAVQAVQQQQLPRAAGSSRDQDAGVAAEAATAASHASSCAAAGQPVITAKGNSRSKGDSKRPGVSWKGGKGLNVVVGRVARAAAAGTLAAASLAGGNHPLLRLARVGPLMYLLRAGL